MKEMHRHKGKLRITFDALRVALGMSPEARVLAIECTPRQAGQEIFYAYVEHPNMPKWVEGMEVAIVDLADIEGDAGD